MRQAKDGLEWKGKKAIRVMEPIKAYNDHNVYIVGAGFSAEAGLPLIKNFMNRMRDAAPWLQDQGGREKEIKAIERVLDLRLRAAAAAYRVPLNVENIEELFSLASASGDAKLSGDVTTAIAATLDFCGQSAAQELKENPISMSRLGDSDWTVPQNWVLHDTQEPANRTVYKCPRYEFYLGLMCGYFSESGLDRQDTIISFNYDTVIEDALWGLGLEPRYADDPKMVEWRRPVDATRAGRRAIPVLKLHGSVNQASGGPRRLLAYPSYAGLRVDKHTPLLVAPTWQKSLRGHLSEVWKDAVKALRTATRVVIMGYSVPQTDQHFRYLLAAGLQRNISLRKILFVNDTDGRLLKQHLYNLNLFREEHFEHGIIEPIEPRTRTVKDFLEGGEGRELIGRKLKEPTWRKIDPPISYPPPPLCTPVSLT